MLRQGKLDIPVSSMKVSSSPTSSCLALQSIDKEVLTTSSATSFTSTLSD